MTFAELKRVIEGSRAQRNEYFSRLYGYETIEDFEGVDEDNLYPSNRYYTIQLFYDPARFRTAAERRRLLAQAQAQRPGRKLKLRALDPKDLSNFSISPHAYMEELFVKRGHVTDVEGRSEDHGRRNDLLVVARNIAALQTNGFFWSLMLQEKGRSLGFALSRFKEEREEQVLDIMAPVFGKRTEIVARRHEADDENEDRPSILPLVMHEQLMLGTDVPVNYTVHLAYEATPGTVVDLGSRLKTRRLMYHNRASATSAQVAFEMSHSQELFGDRDATGAEANKVMNAAILTWFSQVIVAQRKICWISRARRTWDVGTTQIRAEAELHGSVTGVDKLPRKVGKAKNWQQQIEAATEAALSKIEHATDQTPAGFVYEASLDDRVIAALNGSAIECPDTDDELAFFEGGLHTVVLAYWIGSLKRTGEQTLDAMTARYIRQSWKAIQAGNNCLLGQFPEEIWHALVEIAESFVPPIRHMAGRLPSYDRRGFNEPTPITVTYAWLTPQTLREPRLQRRTRTRLELRGPMLCFPSNQAEYWKQKARIVRSPRGFSAPPKAEP
jgi:hypothetical protein